MASSKHSLPETHRALVLQSTDLPLQVKSLPTPQPTPGSCVVRVIAASISGYAGDIYNGKRGYPLATPSVVGASCVARVAATGPDTTSLAVGDLVFVDSCIHARDDYNTNILTGIHEGFSEGSRVLARGEWRDSTYAEYAKVPLESCEVLDEKRLLGRLGYAVEELGRVNEHAVALGGLADVGTCAGETVIIAPATGTFGSAAVRVALALGAAKVVAVGRSKEKLSGLAALNERVATQEITGDMEADLAALKKEIGGKGADVYFDISPPQATNSTHFKSCLMALRPGGRVSLMGGVSGDVGLPMTWIMFQKLVLKGTYMYTREQRRQVVKLVEAGMLTLGNGPGSVTKFGLDRWAQAFETAQEGAGTGIACVFCP